MAEIKSKIYGNYRGDGRLGVRDEREKREKRERESKLAESSSMNLNKNGRAGGGASEDCSRDGRSEKYDTYI